MLAVGIAGDSVELIDVQLRAHGNGEDLRAQAAGRLRLGDRVARLVVHTIRKHQDHVRDVRPPVGGELLLRQRDPFLNVRDAHDLRHRGDRRGDGGRIAR